MHVFSRHWFILGLLGAVALAFLAPGPGATGGWLHPEFTTPAAIAVVFFVQGLVLALDALRSGLLRWRLHLLVQGFTYLVIPILAVALDLAFGRGLPESLRIGFLFLAVLPTTISSAVVFTSLAGGNTAGALVNASLSSLLGVVLTPLWISALLETRDESLPLWPMIRALLALVVLPLVLGQVVRIFVRGWAQMRRVALANLNSGMVLFIVYAAFSESVRGGTWTQQGWRPAVLALVGAGVLFALVLGLTACATRVFRLRRDDRIAALFCAPQKTLASGAPLAKLLFASDPALGLILLPVMFYHPLQLLVSGALVNLLKSDGAENPPEPKT